MGVGFGMAGVTNLSYLLPGWLAHGPPLNMARRQPGCRRLVHSFPHFKLLINVRSFKPRNKLLTVAKHRFLASSILSPCGCWRREAWGARSFASAWLARSRSASESGDAAAGLPASRSQLTSSHTVKFTLFGQHETGHILALASAGLWRQTCRILGSEMLGS